MEYDKKFFSSDKETKLKLPQISFVERVFRVLWGVVEVTLVEIETCEFS